jgi:hypothetical protein
VFVDFVVDLADDGATEPNTLLFFAGGAQHGRKAESQQDRNEDFAKLRIQKRPDLHIGGWLCVCGERSKIGKETDKQLATWV